MASRVADYFDNLRRRFPPESATLITDAQYTFETMESVAAAGRPAASRCAYFEIAGTRFLVWEMDDDQDRFMVFATVYCIPLGILRLPAKPKGIIDIAGFNIDLEALAGFIGSTFAAARRPSAEAMAAKKRKIMLFGFCESFGHHFWNEVSGLMTSMDTGLFDGLDGVLVGPFDYFHLEPMLRARGKQVWKTKNTGTLLPEQLMVYRNNVATEDARRLVIGHAASQAAARTPPAPGQRGICFQIRRHRRPWIHEEDKLIEIITASAREWPGTVFYLDGFGTSQGIIPIYAEQTAEESAFAARLICRLDPSIQVQPIIGVDINEKINLLKHADLFVGPAGSGGVMSSWLLRKPTIIYGPSALYDMLSSQEQTVPEGGSMVSAVPRNMIVDVNDGRMSFDVPAEAIMTLIRQHMNKGAAA